MFFFVTYNKQQYIIYCLVQLYKFKIILIAACFLIIESIDAHVGFLHLLGSIIKRGGGVLHGCTVTTISGVRTVPLERLRRLGFTWNTLLISIEFLGYHILLLLFFNRNSRSFTFYTDMQLILLQSSCKRAQWKLAFKWPSAVNHLLSRGKDYANERNESLLSNCRAQLIFCKDG